MIDPIDGTTNFIYGFLYAVSAALTVQETKKVVFGVVYSPKTDTLYYGRHGQDGFVIKDGDKKRLKVGSFTNNEGKAIFGMLYNRKKIEKILNAAERIHKLSSDLKRIGPSSLDICMVAEGKAKLNFELDLNIWGICVRMLILTEAGGDYK